MEYVLPANSLTCCVCYELMMERDPRVLSCLHSLCFKCIIDIAKGKNSISCPMCRKFTTAEGNDWSDLPKNLLFASLKEKPASQTILCKICSNAHLQIHSTYHCRECEIDLCVDCRKTHLSLPICAHHKVSERLGEIEDYKCKLHNKDVKYICKKCDKDMCIECVHLPLHFDHHEQIASVQTIFQSSSTELSSGLTQEIDRLRAINDLLQQWIQNISKTDLGICESSAIAKRKVEQDAAAEKRRIDEEAEKYEMLLKENKKALEETFQEAESLLTSMTHVRNQITFTPVRVSKSTSKKLEELKDLAGRLKEDASKICSQNFFTYKLVTHPQRYLTRSLEKMFVTDTNIEHGKSLVRSETVKRFASENVKTNVPKVNTCSVMRKTVDPRKHGDRKKVSMTD